MIYSIKDQSGNEIRNNRLRNEIIHCYKNDRTSTQYDNEIYHIDKIEVDRSSYKQIIIRKD